MNCPHCHESIDPASIPDQVLASERGRRNAAKRTNVVTPRNGGRPGVPTPCPVCGAEQPSKKAALAHCPRP